MFINNKYYKLYYNIIDKALSRDILFNEYYETHHIIPRSLNGSNNKSNLVRLTGREHFLCHWLLTKFTEGDNKRKMIYAFNALCNLNNQFQKRQGSKYYEHSRKMYAAEMSRRMKGENNPAKRTEVRRKISESKKGKYTGVSPWNKNKQLSNEHKEKISLALSGHHNPMFGKLHSDETKKLISEKRKGHSDNKGITKTDEHKEKISQKLKGRLLSQKHKNNLKKIPKVECEYCKKRTSPAMHSRWHGLNCKHKKI